MKQVLSILLFLSSFLPVFAQAPATGLWHGKERVIRYMPDGNDFVIVNGDRRFNRALYGTNTGFRVEAGDLPEFALYMPGMGGNFKFGISQGGKSKWLHTAKLIRAVYRAGSMHYEIKDPMFGNGIVFISVLALADAEGMIVKLSSRNVTTDVELIWSFGGASGKKFSRDGDIGADPESSFYLHEENCRDNSYSITANKFELAYGPGNARKKMSGLFSQPCSSRLADASKQATPHGLHESEAAGSPVLTGKLKLNNTTVHFLIQSSTGIQYNDPKTLPAAFDSAEAKRKALAQRIKLNTPDKYLNTLGGALSIAADAIWEDPTYLHGAVAWRMRLNAWRGAYVADPLGWHDRARKHFSSYALSQVTTPPVSGVVMDTALHLARHQEKIGTALFSEGYICRNPNGDIRPHHYDMNLVFVDQLLNHFNWTGDTAYVKEMWPLLVRHLRWEKRNFDSDDDGLYDAYAAIWASDALAYSGGAVTHSSAYNYRANKTMANLAGLVGLDPKPYETEAHKIAAAVQKELWLPDVGWYAEYKDKMGMQLVHPAPALWTIYHAIDSKLPDGFQAFQTLRYVDMQIPHIPVRAKGFEPKHLYLLSTSNWQPYTWSVNNVALAENLHTALAYWQGNQAEKAFRLWRSAILESMYLGASPGGFQQLSFYDAIRGELYRDFADPIGMAGRTLVEGLFGIQPNALDDTLTIQPGIPRNWNFATLEIPDVHFDFKRTGTTARYTISQFFKKNLHLKLLLPAFSYEIASLTINGKPFKWSIVTSAVGTPVLQINAPAANRFEIVINWKGTKPVESIAAQIVNRERFTIYSDEAKFLKIYDPQMLLDSVSLEPNRLRARAADKIGPKMLFLQVSQGAFTWWQPVSLTFLPRATSSTQHNGSWTINDTRTVFEKVDLGNYFNEKVTSIFQQQYLSPRPPGPTLQLPVQGIGNWCYPLVTATISDSGMRKQAGAKNELYNTDSIPFATPSDTTLNNIVFTSQWDNFPDSVRLPLSGNASLLYLLMAGTTNPMQSRITNGMVVVKYADGTSDTLLLKNPENWWPIEQDYYVDGFAFTTGDEIPERLYFREGKFARGLDSYTSIKGFSNRAIDGGAATVLSMYLNKTKNLQSLTLHSIANDVVIGLMAATLVR